MSKADTNKRIKALQQKLIPTTPQVFILGEDEPHPGFAPGNGPRLTLRLAGRRRNAAGELEPINAPT